MLLILYNFMINHQSDFKNLIDESSQYSDYKKQQTVIDCFLTLQQKFNHFITFILSVLKIRYIIMF